MIGVPVSLLDNIRISNNPESLKNFFRNLFHTDRDKLLELLNDRHLRFYTLFLLKSDIYASRLSEYLNPVYKQALMLSDILSGTIPDRSPEPDRTGRRRDRTAIKRASIRKMLHSDAGNIPAALKWIIETGWDPDIPENGYELLLERCTAILLGEFRDSSSLPALADTIFERHRNGLLIHNLVWAFFRARDPGSLYLLAQKLLSENTRDVALAKKLLRFIPGLDDSGNAAGPVLYFRAMRWLSENGPYLYFTDESMQMCGSPIFCGVSAEARYLCRPVSPDNGKLLAPLHEHEEMLLDRFRKLAEAQQQQLADFSCMLSKRDIYQWSSWIRLPIADQLETASLMTGGSA